MEVTKAQAINGIVRYVRNEVIKKIPEQGFKTTLAFLVNLIELDNSIVDKYIGSFFDSDGCLCLDNIERAMCRAIDEYGSFPLSIPGIPLISPEVKTMKFTSEDIKKLKSYMEE